MRKVLQAGEVVRLTIFVAAACALVCAAAVCAQEQSRPEAVLFARPAPDAGGADLVLSTGHPNEIDRGEFTPDGVRVITTGRGDRHVRVWHALSGIEERAFPGEDFAVSGDGNVLATADGLTVTIWELATGRRLRSIQASDQVRSLALGRTGGLAALHNAKTGTIGIYDGEKRVREIDSGWMAEPLLRFSETGRRLIALDSNGDMEIRWTLRSWDLLTGKMLLERAGKTPSFYHGTDLSGSATRMAVVEQGGVAIWDAATGTRIKRLPGKAEVVRLSADGRALVAYDMGPGGVAAGPAHLWDVTGARPIRSFDQPVLALGPKASLVLTARGEVLSAAGSVPLLQQHGTTALAWVAPDSLAAGSDRGLLLVYDAATGRLRSTRPAGPGALAQISASADARRILAASADGDVTVVEDGRVRPLAALGRWITAAAISRDGTRGAIAKVPAASIHVWDLSSGAEIRKLYGDPRGVSSLALSPDGKWLAAGGVDGRVQVWDVASGNEIVSLQRSALVSAMAFSPDSELLAFGTSVHTRLTRAPNGQWQFPPVPAPGSTGEITIVDVGQRRPRAALSHADRTPALCFTTMRTLRAISGQFDRPGTVQDYDGGTGRELRKVRDGIQFETTALFNPDGTFLISNVPGLGIRVWRLPK